jgi:hypothetical protein
VHISLLLATALLSRILLLSCAFTCSLSGAACFARSLVSSHCLLAAQARFIHGSLSTVRTFFASLLLTFAMCKSALGAL